MKRVTSTSMEFRGLKDLVASRNPFIRGLLQGMATLKPWYGANYRSEKGPERSADWNMQT